MSEVTRKDIRDIYVVLDTMRKSIDDIFEIDDEKTSLMKIFNDDLVSIKDELRCLKEKITNNGNSL